MNVVLLHDLGDPSGGAAWRDVAPIGWNVLDLPGHGAAGLPRSGHYDPMAAATIARWALNAEQSAGQAVVVGVGSNAHSALVCASGGVTTAAVIVDGLWGPWLTPRAQVDTQYAMIRAIADDVEAIATAPQYGIDPRTRYGYCLASSDEFLRYFWGSIDHPVLAIETPRSLTPAAERAPRLEHFAGEATLVELSSDAPQEIVKAIEVWLGT